MLSNAQLAGSQNTDPVVQTAHYNPSLRQELLISEPAVSLEVTMFQGTSAQLTLTSDDGNDDKFAVLNAKASDGDVKMEGNVLTFTPPADFVGTSVVSYTATEGHKATQDFDRKVVVHVVEPPSKQAKSGMAEIALPSASEAAAARKIIAAAAASLPDAVRNQLEGPGRQEVTMYQGMAAQLTLTSDEGNEDAFQVKDASASCGKCDMAGNVLTYTPPEEFVGIVVVSYTAVNGGRSDKGKALVVHVVKAPPPPNPNYDNVQP